ncbi:MAG: Radical domain protein [Deltaproteobacteria bacterium]|nr:Radical domain protein [Deltaproteobacteria bacterium]
MQHVFGPVPSRRLGYSLGVDIIPPKYCSYDCVYCQIGKTTHSETARKSFYNPRTIIEQVIEKVSGADVVDIITFSGSGEPTLNADLGFMIREIKQKTSVPVAVITNGSLLCDKDVRDDLGQADIVLPSLDAVSQNVFERINRPHPSLDINAVIEGLKAFRAEYKGQIWLEVMLIKNINDDPYELKKMTEIVLGLNMDRIQLNTVTRPPSEPSAARLTDSDLKEICGMFGPSCEIISTFEKAADIHVETTAASIILETLKRRPLTLDDVVRITGMSPFEAKTRLNILEKEGLITTYVLNDELFYVSS